MTVARKVGEGVYAATVHATRSAADTIGGMIRLETMLHPSLRKEMPEETKWYDYNGVPATWSGGDILRADGSRIFEITKFMHEAIPLTKEEYEALLARHSDSGGKRELAFAVHPDDVKGEAGKDKLAGDIAAEVVKSVDAERERQGLGRLEP